MGLDLSLTSTGCCNIKGDCYSLKPSYKGAERLEWFADTFDALSTAPNRPDLVVLEGYAYGRVNKAHELGELGGVVRLALWRAGIPFVVVPPSTLKKYATGKGNASKDQVLIAAVKRSGIEFNNNDEADAWWLRQIGLQQYEVDDPTHVQMPLAHLGALTGVVWLSRDAIECSNPANRTVTA